jgi:predicted DNA-binding protein
MTNVFKRIANKSSGDLYILTARAAYKPVKEYIKDIGVKNVYVVALASNNPQDKADWIEDKIDNEGYDDIYFADDSLKNVKTTKQMLSKKDGIKYRVQHIKH